MTFGDAAAGIGPSESTSEARQPDSSPGPSESESSKRGWRTRHRRHAATVRAYGDRGGVCCVRHGGVLARADAGCAVTARRRGWSGLDAAAPCPASELAGRAEPWWRSREPAPAEPADGSFGRRRRCRHASDGPGGEFRRGGGGRLRPCGGWISRRVPQHAGGRHGPSRPCIGLAGSPPARRFRRSGPLDLEGKDSAAGAGRLPASTLERIKGSLPPSARGTALSRSLFP